MKEEKKNQFRDLNEVRGGVELAFSRIIHALTDKNLCFLILCHLHVCDSLQFNKPAPADAQPVKVTANDVGTSKVVTPPKATLSPGSETDSTSGEMSLSSWVVDSSGFLSPAGPVLKEVLDLVEGVCV